MRQVTRDPAMDLVRVLCVALVVVGHLLMVGAWIDPAHGLVVEKTLLDEPWFGPVSWIVQIMPLFFVVGGFAGYGSWTRLEASGGTAADYIRSRILRLAKPAVALYGAIAIAIAIMLIAGVDPVSVSLIAAGITSPLWFLAAYAFAQTLLPTMVVLHGRRPVTTVVALAVGSAILDLVRLVTGVDAVGILAMIFVWLFVQQLGFWIADGWFARRRRSVIVLIGAAAYLGLAGLVIAGYPPNMLDNLNPPTFAICALAVAQTCLLVLAAPALRRVARSRAVASTISLLGSRLVTIYLWHLPIMSLIIGIALLTPIPTPQPGSAAWWWTRPAVLIVVIAALTLVIRLAGGLEKPSPLPPGVHAGDTVTGLSAAAVVLPPFATMLYGLDLVVATAGAVLLGLAVAALQPEWAGAGARRSHAPGRAPARERRRPDPSLPS